VFISALIGAALGGIVGVLIAIPLTSAGWVLARDLIALRHARHEARMEAQDEGGGPRLEPPPPEAGEPGSPAPG